MLYFTDTVLYTNNVNDETVKINKSDCHPVVQITSYSGRREYNNKDGKCRAYAVALLTHKAKLTSVGGLFLEQILAKVPLRQSNANAFGWQKCFNNYVCIITQP